MYCLFYVTSAYKQNAIIVNGHIYKIQGYNYVNFFINGSDGVLYPPSGFKL